jgi:lipoprotein signal peptidase
VGSRRRLALAAAAAVLVVDLAHDASARVRFHHPRPPLVLALAVMLGAALLWIAPRVASRAVALGAGVAAGGALATALSGFVWTAGVPDPLTQGGVAFNLADVAIGAGDVLLVAAALGHAWVNRARLREPI